MRKIKAVLVGAALATSALSVSAIAGPIQSAQADTYYMKVCGDHSIYREPGAKGLIGTAKNESKFDWYSPGPGWWAWGYSYSLQKKGWIEVRFLVEATAKC